MKKPGRKDQQGSIFVKSQSSQFLQFNFCGCVRSCALYSVQSCQFCGSNFWRQQLICENFPLYRIIIIGKKCIWEEKNSIHVCMCSTGLTSGGPRCGAQGAQGAWAQSSSKEDHRFSMKDFARRLSRHLPQTKKFSIYHELTFTSKM